MAEVFFPIFLKLSKRPCLLIGGEGCAVEKGRQLLASGASLTIVAPRLALTLQAYAQAGRVTWLAETFQEKHMENVWFVVSTLQNTLTNRRIFAEANRRCLFLNVVDQPEFCSFHWPASIHRPPVSVAFATGGNSPALSGYLRRTMERLLPENIGDFSHWLADWRKQVSPLLADLEAKGHFWRTLFDQGLAERYLSGDKAGAEKMIRDALGYRHT